MKRLLILFVLLTSIIPLSAQVATITLSSGGKLQFFNPDQLGAAIDAANPNDTIYLSNGKFSGLPAASSRYNITKPIVLIGSGAKVCNVYFPNGYDLYFTTPSAEDSFVIEGVSFGRSIRFDSEMDKLTIRNSDASVYINKPLNYLNVDRSKCDIHLDGNTDDDIVPVKNVTVVNSHIGTLYNRYSDGGSCLIDHCYISSLNNNFVGYITNSIVNNCNSSQATLENCYTYSSNNAQNKINCSNCTGSQCDNYIAGQYEIADEWLGSDGTPVGLMGGNGPKYSLNSSYPTPDAENSTIEYDKVNKKINVKIVPIKE